MHGRLDWAELGERIAADGPHRYEWALQELALAVQTHAPGAASVLRDRSAPTVLRERAFAVVTAVMLRSARLPERPAESDPSGEDLRRHHLDWHGQLVGWGA